jgi:hypothetical protein
MTTVATRIDISRFADGIRDQAQQGACKAFQITGAVQLMSKMMGVDLPDFSPQQVYNDTRIKMGTLNTDSGSFTSSAEWVAKTIGLALESSFAYGTSNLYVTPSAAVHAEAGEFKVQGFTHTNIEKSDVGVANWIGAQLMQGKPVLVDAYVHYGFGVDPNQFLNPINGGHAYLVTGIDYTTRTYTVMNSWGSGWANGGFGTIKFSDLPGIGPTSGGAWGSPYQDLLGLSTIDGFDGIGLLWTEPRLEVARYYATVLDRAAEITGLDFWAGYDTVFTNAQMADMMIGSAEGQALYGGKTHAQQLDIAYHNILGRAPDQAGLGYFLGLMDGGQTLGQIMSGMIDYTYANNTDAAGHDFLLNTTNLSAYMSITMQYGGGHDTATAAALNQVTVDANQLEIIKIGLPAALFA